MIARSRLGFARSVRCSFVAFIVLSSQARAQQCPVSLSEFEARPARIVSGLQGILVSFTSEPTVVLVPRQPEAGPVNVGRGGAAPGEFRSVSAFGFAGESVWVYDGILRRLSLFAFSGRLVTTHDLRLVPVPAGREFVPVALVGDTAVVGSFHFRTSGRSGGEYLDSPIVRVSLTGEVPAIESIASVSARNPFVWTSLGASGSVATFVPAASRNDDIAGSPNGRWVAWTNHEDSGRRPRSRVRVVRYDTETQELRSFFLSQILEEEVVQRQAKLRAFIESHFQELAVAGAPVGRDAVSQILRHADGNEAFHHGLLVTDDGQMWTRETPIWEAAQRWRRVGEGETPQEWVSLPSRVAAVATATAIGVCETESGSYTLFERSR